jgi:exodeoxyribonuclease III
VPEATLLCWNVAGRVKRLREQAELVAGAALDIVCLQEISAATVAGWAEQLSGAGWAHVAVTESPRDPGRRPLRVLTATRAPLSILDVPGLPWPERVIAVSVDGLELVNVHSPISARPDLVKVRTHEAVFAHLSNGWGPRLLCGDLNTPRREHPDGRVWTFARDRYGKLRPERGERWDEAELSLIKGLESHGFRDAFRAAHGYEAREPSWVWQRWGGGYRLDHLIASDEVTVSEIAYVHAWRDAGLSDHSPLVARVAWE